MNAYDFLWQRLHKDKLFGTDIDDLLQEIADIMDDYVELKMKSHDNNQSSRGNDRQEA